VREWRAVAVLMVMMVLLMVVVTGESDAAAGVGIAEGGSAIVPVVYDVLLSADVPSSKAQSEQTRPTKRRSISSV